MTDLELTKLAAEAVGIDISREDYGFLWYLHEGGNKCYWPLTDTAQAFELMEKLRMDTQFVEGDWEACVFDNVSNPIAKSEWQQHLKRAIVECAARYALWKREQK